MSRERPLPPPKPADALLLRLLPRDVRGLSILGDLHQEFEDLQRAGRLRAPGLWYWRSALGLGARYGWLRVRSHAQRAGPRTSMGEMTLNLLADVRYGIRMLIKTPLLSAVAVLTVAMGVALTTHTFSSVYGTIVRGVPVPGHDRLTFIGASRLDIGISQMELSVHDFEDLQRQQTSFEDVAAFYQGTANLSGDEGPPERFHGAYVSDNFFRLLGIAPMLGRTFREGEDDSDAAPTVVLGHQAWQNRFAGDPGIVGRSIRVNGLATQVIGVMPEGFRFPFLEDVWLTHRLDVSALARGEGQHLDVFGRLRQGVTIEAARAELTSVAARLAATHPQSNERLAFTVAPYEERFMPPQIQAVLWVMLVATFGVLLIACANVANLLMARASVRSREIAIRTAMGAARWRVIRQLLLESAALAVLGGIVGVALAAWGLAAYRNAIADIYKPYWIDFGMDVPTVLFSVAVTTAAAVAAGLLPALRATGVSIGENLKDESRGSSGLRLGRLSTSLVISEIAVSCALLVGAGFMIKSVVNLRNVDLGFETEGVMTGRVGLFETDYPSQDDRIRFFNRLKERLEMEPGVVSAALGSDLPGLGGSQYFWSVSGASYPTDGDHPVVTTTVVTPDYFNTFGVDMVQGRDFTAVEAVPGGDGVVIVNQSFADNYLGGTSVLGAQLRLGLSDSTRPWRRVVGVVPDMHIGGNVGGIGDDKVRPERVFLPQGALDASFMSLAVHTQGDPEQMAPSIRSIVQELDPNLPVYDLQALSRAVRDATWAFGLFGTLFTIFGAAALFLAAVGLYGVMAFSVAMRRQEMGIRMALGAEPPAILRMVLSRGARQLAAGIGLGVALGAVMARSMSVLLYGVETGDPVVYGSIVATLTVTGLVACLLPARSATRTDVVRTMRGE